MELEVIAVRIAYTATLVFLIFLLRFVVRVLVFIIILLASGREQESRSHTHNDIPHRAGIGIGS